MQRAAAVGSGAAGRAAAIGPLRSQPARPPARPPADPRPRAGGGQKKGGAGRRRAARAAGEQCKKTCDGSAAH